MQGLKADPSRLLSLNISTFKVMHISPVVETEISTFIIFYVYQLKTYIPWFLNKIASVFIPRNSRKERMDEK